MRKNLIYMLLTIIIMGASCKTSKNNNESELQEHTMKESEHKKNTENYALLGTQWNLVTLRGLDISAESSLANQPFIQFKEGNLVFGSNSCNTFRGSFNMDAERHLMSLGKLAATKRACPEMKVGKLFIEVLSMVDNYSIQGNTLQLNKAKMAPLAVFEAAESTADQMVLWINDHKVDCEGEGKQKCLQVKYGDSLKDGKWQNFYSNIKGFNYEPGNIYKLSVIKTERSAAMTPQGASKYQYALNKVIEKKSAANKGIHDIWALTALNGKAYKTESSATQPRLEINTTEKLVYGTDGCNNFQGQILAIDDEQLKIEPLMSTLKLCKDMAIPNQFNELLEKVAKYKKHETNLDLMDENGNTLLSFKKVD